MSETKRQRELEAKRQQMLKDDIRRASQLEKEVVKDARPNTVIETIDYAERTRQFESEMAEQAANLEAMGEKTGSSTMNDYDYIVYDNDFRKLADFIGIDMSELKKYASELYLIMDWAKETTRSKDILDNLLQVKDLKKSLGFQEVGPSMLKKLYQYIRLDLDGKRSEQPNLVEIKKEKELIKND